MWLEFLGKEDYFNVHFLREQWKRDKLNEGVKWFCRIGLTPRGCWGQRIILPTAGQIVSRFWSPSVIPQSLYICMTV